MDITRWSILKSDWLYSLQPKMETFYTVSKKKKKKKDLELTVAYLMNIAKFRHKLKKVGKTTRSFRYDLNQIPYNYTVEMKNRFKEFNLIVSEELWMKVCVIVHEAGIKTNPKKKKFKKEKWLSEEALQIAVKRREAKGKGEKERYTHLNANIQRIAKR